MPKDMQARQLIKQVPACGTIDMDFGAQTATLTGEGWEVNDLYNMSFLWRGYIDLAGYTKDDLTFFTQAVDIQNAMLAGGTPYDPATGNGIQGCVIYDIVTTRYVRTEEAAVNNVGFIGPLPNLDLQEVIYGEARFFVPYSTDNGLWRVLQSDSFGVGSPTATDRLHITRIVLPLFAGPSEAVNIPPCNFVIGGVTAHEKDLVYVERLRRAYTQDAGRNV
jgi:hypothetical protein